MCPAYVAGLIGPGDRKSVQPMAARDNGVNHDRLHHFIAIPNARRGRGAIAGKGEMEQDHLA
jgi:hypothetical protein